MIKPGECSWWRADGTQCRLSTQASYETQEDGSRKRIYANLCPHHQSTHDAQQAELERRIAAGEITEEEAYG